MAAGISDDQPPTASRRRRPCQVPSTPAVVAATLVVGLLLAAAPATATRCDDIEVGTGEDDDWRPPSTVEVVLQAQSVIYGHVRRTFPDSSFPGTLVYTARMEVYCTLKGRRLDRVVNVSRAGYMPGSCYSARLTPGRDYIVIAEVTETVGGLQVRPVDTEIVATPRNIDEVVSACRLRPHYPHGVNELNARVQCPSPAPPSECLDEQDFTTTTTTTPTTTSIYSEYDIYYDDYMYHPPFDSDPLFTNPGAALVQKTTPTDGRSGSTASSLPRHQSLGLCVRSTIFCLVYSLCRYAR